MMKKGLTAAALAVCVLAVPAEPAQAAEPGFRGSLLESLTGPPGPRPPPRLGSDPETNPPGPRPPPKFDGSDPVTNPGNEGPDPPIG